MSNPHQSSIQQQLRELDQLYHESAQTILDSLSHKASYPAYEGDIIPPSAYAAYDAMWQALTARVQSELPGFTLAYAEMYTAGTDRQAHGGMRHVLLSVERSA